MTDPLAPDLLGPHLRIATDVVAGSTLLASILSWLPTTIGVIGGCLSIIWFLIQIRESRSFTEFVDRRRERKHTTKLRRLRAAQKVIEAKIIAADRVRAAVAEASQIVELAKTDAALVKVQDKALDTFIKT